MSKLFSQDGFLWRWLNVVTDIFLLSLMWLAFSLPLVTLGAATTALYDSVVRCIRFKQPGAYSRFIKTFKADILTSIFTTLLWAVIIALFVLIIKFFQSVTDVSPTAKGISAAYYVILLIPAGAACWVSPILSRFTFGFKALNLTAVKFSFAHLPSTIILVLMTVELINICLKWLVPMFFVPALTMLLWSLFVEPVFKKHGGAIESDASEQTTDAEKG